ncbi:MAG: SRPBCC domain-containing protein, partial [Candidatus Sulfotelmatobacter sp.]
MATVAITPDQNAVVGEIFIAAPPARVFAAITDPSQMPRWWGQEGMYRVTEWKADLCVGGKWSSVGVGADGTSFRVAGEYLEVDPPRLLVHTWVASYTGPLKTIVRW